MKAILLAAGLGTRLRPITDNIPKCLVPINGYPLLGLWIDKLIDLGVKEILINTHYYADQVVKFVEQHQHKKHIKLVYEDILLGTGGTLVNNAEFWQGHNCWVIHADNYCEDSLIDMLVWHKSHADFSDGTVLTFETDTPSACGIVQLDERKRVIGFQEKPPNPTSNLASGALFLFSANVYEQYFSSLTKNTFYDLSRDIIPKMVNHLTAYHVKGNYLDIGTPDTYHKVQSLQC
ncbi:hypothetical protein N480_01345 [Pseudoalteromonas luteoviolacea S2607]|uniref:nucleotidyltransferase family protein n=1 Tax=Pseudoalteromonas luteoviolacea TaxID=43657 RepID=UPI0007B05C77|nr:nucleotidyltransferase family protein [Pseudoalteromonas luteoviolacea]KZN39508.1 hypothetical protein N480_01345 [Pseudoalteromonas luteoviolacea S2607]